jgi:ligand-binding sensor domain-containing protein
MLEYRVTQILEDDNRVAWLGVWGIGPAKGDLTILDLALLPQGLYDDDVATMDADGDDFWFLGGGDGLPGTITYYNRADQVWEYFDSQKDRGIASDQFYAIAHDAKNVWIGSELGLIRMNRSSKTFKSYGRFEDLSGERVTALLPIKNNLLIGTDRGISVYDLRRDSIYSANTDLTQSRLVFDFAQRDSTIFAATDIGILTLTWGGSNWRRLLLDSPYLRTNVYDLQVIDSLLYTISDDGVVVINLKDHSSTIFDRNTVFSNIEMTSLLVHQGVIWAGTNSGLFRYNSRKGTWYRYTTSDGLIGMRIRSLVGDGNYVWIGTDHGVTRFLWNDFDRSDWMQ